MTQSDLISRQALCDDLREYKVHPVPISSDESEVKGYNDGIDLSISIISKFPSAEPEQKWIPVSKALPKNDDWVIVSIYDDYGDTPWRYTIPGFYVPYGKCWIVDNEYCRNVIAWMPLPESWRGE